MQLHQNKQTVSVQMGSFLKHQVLNANFKSKKIREQKISIGIGLHTFTPPSLICPFTSPQKKNYTNSGTSNVTCSTDAGFYWKTRIPKRNPVATRCCSFLGGQVCGSEQMCYLDAVVLVLKASA